jgi:hypothetical protein
MATKLGVALSVIVLAACSGGGGGATGPIYPSLAGTYSTAFSTTASSIYGTQTLSLTPGSITLGSPNSAGDFAGSYIDAGSTGTIDGFENTAGDITITHFGDPNQSPLLTAQFLVAQYPQCDFSQATTTGLTGTIIGSALTLSGGITLPCLWTVNGVAVAATTTLGVQVSGTLE